MSTTSPHLLTGVYVERTRGGWFEPDAPRRKGAEAPAPLFVPREGRGAARDGDVVRVERPRGGHPRVVEVLGRAGDVAAEIPRILGRTGFAAEFPTAVLAAADGAPAPLDDAERARRRDLRDLPLVTIDPARAADHDDAVHVERRAPHGFRLFVAIADVAHYVRPGTAIDLEARRRATSVYFPDRALPMLPHRLSGDLCSLGAGVDRLALVVTIDFDAAGAVQATRFVEAVIRCRAGMTYAQAQAVLDGAPEAAAVETDLHEHLRVAWRLASVLRRRREKRGSLDFDLPEAEFELDLQGEPTDVVRATRADSNRLVEEFMLAANEAVARRLHRRRVPTLYRVHAPPDPRKLVELAEVVRALGLDPSELDPRRGRPVDPRQFQRLLRAAGSEPRRRFLEYMLLRSLARAEYGAERRGHFGLACDDYVHFTSPIRRYPDLVVHRQLKGLLDSPAGVARFDGEELTALAAHCSEREQAAVSAERDAVDLLRARFMRDKVGQRFDGFVASVTEFGVFVQLSDYFVEGLVHVARLGGDEFYVHDASRHTLTGRRSGAVITVGTALRIEVLGVNLARRFIDFGVVQPERPERPRRR
jgi:ribonuclease R